MIFIEELRAKADIPILDYFPENGNNPMLRLTKIMTAEHFY